MGSPRAGRRSDVLATLDTMGKHFVPLRERVEDLGTDGAFRLSLNCARLIRRKRFLHLNRSIMNGNDRISLQDIQQLTNAVEPQLEALILVGTPPLF